MSGWVVDAVIASALLLAAVLAFRIAVRRLFGPTVAYALWALPLLRLFAPPLPEAWRVSAAPITRAGEIVAEVAAPVEALAAPAGGGPIGWATIVAFLWAAGAVAFFLAHLLAHRRHRSMLLRDHHLVDRIGGVHVVLSPAAAGPLALGVLARFVVLPADLDARYDEEERALALAHELGHHARGDILANWAALLLLAVHWWNPLAWMAHRAFRIDQELANDARVLRGRGGAAHAYARAILKTAGGQTLASACHLQTISDLKGRLRMLKNRPASPRRIAAGAASVSMLVLLGLGVTASGTRAAAAAKATVNEAVGVDLDAELDQILAEMPAPQVPPAPRAAPQPRTSPAPAAPPVTPGPVPPAVPPSPPAPPTPLAGSADSHVWTVTDAQGRRMQVVRIGPNGRAFDPSSLPVVEAVRCRTGERPLVRRESKEGRRMVVICTDRITRLADDAARRADQAARLVEGRAESVRGGAMSPAEIAAIERDALRNALEGLRGARRSIESNPHLTPDQRRDALSGIDQGEREIRERVERGD